MKVRVKLFAAAKELASADEIIVDVPSGGTVGDVRAAIDVIHPALKPILSHALWAVGAEYATADTPVNEQSEVALIPPVSGG
ncbi:MAG TPA: MoaD/ThiS family protein [Lacipirellulaceae bacterium]|nr:MoaD/ThiS family protein [Lacipirellulaceae bacterium]